MKRLMQKVRNRLDLRHPWRKVKKWAKDPRKPRRRLRRWRAVKWVSEWERKHSERKSKRRRRWRRRRETAAKHIRKLKRELRSEAVIINRYGAYGRQIEEEAQRANLDLALACALVEQESNFRNIFGCDLGPRSSAPWCNQEVTEERVQALIRHIRAGGASNGVGLTQLTSPGFIDQAERLGGAHKTRNQLQVGFDVLAGLIRSGGERWGLGAYNGGPGNPQWDYADEVLDRKRKWQERLS